MSFRKRMKNKRGALRARHQQQINNKDSKGRFPSVIMKDKLPTGVETWISKEGKYLLDIIPWEAGPNMPLGKGNKPISDEGNLEYVLDIDVHTNVGSMRVPYVCPYENYGQACPICEYMKSHDLDLDTWKLLKPKRRVFYLVWVHTPRELERKGIMLWEISHFAMEEKLAEIAYLPDGGGAIAFSDYEKGKSVAFTRKGSGAKNTQYLGHRFIDRQSRLPDKILDMSFSIDTVIDMHPSYEVIEESFQEQLEQLESMVASTDDAGSNYSDDKQQGKSIWDDDYDDKDDKDEDKPKSKFKKKKFTRKKKKSRFKR